MKKCNIAKIFFGEIKLFFKDIRNERLPADAAGGEEEPVHEDPGAVVVGVIGQEPVPLVLLLTRTVPRTPQRQRATGQANIFM